MNTAFQFDLHPSTNFPSQTCVFWASSLWIPEYQADRVLLLAFAEQSYSEVCRSMSSLVRRAGLKWSGPVGKFQVAVVQTGSYLLREGEPPILLGTQHDPCPSMWLHRMLALNGQEAVVKALNGTFLLGPPWEEVKEVLGQVRER